MFQFGSKVPTISVDDVKMSIDKNQSVNIIDVRTPEEVVRGKIVGSINVPVDNITKIKSLISDKNSTIYLYCLSGSRSNIATEQLQQMGYTNVFSMANGLLAWKIKQYPLVTD